jgi:tetratricopeptide (TPR) repeat protein
LARIHGQLRTYIAAYCGSFLFHELESGRYQQAVRFCQHAVTMSEALMTEQPDEPDFLFMGGVAYFRLGYELWAVGQTKDADESFSKALAALEKAGLDHPRFFAPVAWNEGSQAYANRGKLRAEEGRFAEAKADLLQALALCKKVATTNLGKLPKTQMFQASVEEDLGNVLWATNRREEAADAFRHAEEARKQIVRLAKAKGYPLLSAMARFYATCPDKQFRNPTEAVELAKQAVEEMGKVSTHYPRYEGDCWKTLGVAQYRAGDWKAAVAALEKAMPLRNDGDSSDWFFLAMAHWQLGDKDKARTWLDKAAQWMERNKPRDVELRRFRAEAAALLQIENDQHQKPE